MSAVIWMGRREKTYWHWNWGREKKKTRQKNEETHNKVSKSNTDAISHVTSRTLFCVPFQTIWTGTKIIYQVANQKKGFHSFFVCQCFCICFAVWRCPKMKTSLRSMCVDYVCQWDRLKIIICGLRLANAFVLNATWHSSLFLFFSRMQSPCRMRRQTKYCWTISLRCSNALSNSDTNIQNIEEILLAHIFYHVAHWQRECVV